jgi:hypothetical protein
MLVKMIDNFQGRETNEVQLAPGEIHELETELAEWLIANKKAVPANLIDKSVQAVKARRGKASK